MHTPETQRPQKKQLKALLKISQYIGSTYSSGCQLAVCLKKRADGQRKKQKGEPTTWKGEGNAQLNDVLSEDHC